MQYFGFFLVFVALVALIAGLLQRLKGKKILAAPFKKTGEIAQNPSVAGPTGTISCEGAMVVPQPLVAPCSGKPVVYYEIELVRHWEKSVQTENGMKTEKGTASISKNKNGLQFQVDDGSGAVGVDFRQDVDCDFEKSFEQMQNVSFGDVVFGQHRTHVAHHGGDERTVGVKAIEKIVPAQGNLFVMGKLAAGAITKTDGMMGKIIGSTKGREKLLGATKRNSIIGFVAGGVCLAGGIPMSIFGDAPVDSCANMKDATAEACHGHIYDDNGTTYDWTVGKPGTYTINIAQPVVKDPIWPQLTIKDASGTQVAQTERSTENVSFTNAFPKAGKYSLNIRDSVKGHVQHLKGGYSFTLSIVAAPGSATPQPVAGTDTASTTASASAAMPPTKAAPPPGPAKTPPPSSPAKPPPGKRK